MILFTGSIIKRGHYAHVQTSLNMLCNYSVSSTMADLEEALCPLL